MNLSEIYAIFLAHPSISTDTRKVTQGSLFFALRGANFNGNNFAHEALAKGASYAVVDDRNVATDERLVWVDDVLQTLQQLAQMHRKRFNIPFVAVGGSNGKTTTKELIFSVLSTKYKTFATAGNLNNHIGVPLSLLAIPQDTAIAVIEIGANHLAETYFLCQIAQPTHGVVTNIGLDHLEGFMSLQGVALANAELYQYLAENDGTAFVNTTQALLLEALANYPSLKKITYPQMQDDYRIELLKGDFFVRFQAENQVIQTQLFGDYNFHNLATALCIAHFFEVPPQLAHQAVAQYQPSNMRSQVITKGSNTIILDAYNANPSSMEQALRNFAQIETTNKVVILGNMNELGQASVEEHIKLGELVNNLGFETIIFFGEDIKYALNTNPKAYYFTDKFSLHNWLQDHPFEQSYVLIKGSRGVQLETVLQFL